MRFKYINDIEDWLKPLDYQAFWEEVGPYNLTLQPRDHCDREIASGLVTEQVVLDVLKIMVRIELGRILGLERRAELPDVTWH